VAFLGKLDYYRRMASGLYSLLRTPPYADPDGMIRCQMENRERHFLELARRAIFSNPANPYYQLFQLAGCTYDDLAEAVRRDGLEATLAALHRQGVYLAHDEFKGKQPIRRSGREIPATPASFRNPLVKGGIETTSGGSRSGGTTTPNSRSQRVHGEAYRTLDIREFSLAGRQRIQLKPILPAGDGLLAPISYSRLGCPLEKWFSTYSKSLDSMHYQVATRAMVALARLWGEKVPFPAFLPPNDFLPVAEWISSRRRQGQAVAVTCHPSPAVRVAVAAAEKGLDIGGTLFQVGGETVTEPKRRTIEATGAEVFTRYGITEIGPIGYACRQMTTGNSVHLFHDSVAVINYRRTAPLSGAQVDSLLFTTLLPCAALALINVEMDDCGVLARATCDCTHSRAGFTTQIRDIFSYGKLTGQGVTLVGTDVLDILERVLPARFGGGPLDYQLVEEDAPHQARIVLRVSRRVSLPSPEAVRDCFLSELRRFQGGTGALRVWRSTGALQVVHEDPLVTRVGKVLPLHLLGTGSRSTDAT
jgi:hypothetical protein